VHTLFDDIVVAHHTATYQTIVTPLYCPISLSSQTHAFRTFKVHMSRRPASMFARW